MQDIATSLRALQLFAHNAHNLAYGKEFFQDHEFFGELYEAYEDEYDMVVERAIGEDTEIDLKAVTTQAGVSAGKLDADDCEMALNTVLASEKRLCDQIRIAVKTASDGTQNMLQGIADNSLTRQYKISRRLL